MNDSELLMKIRNAARFAFVEYFRPLRVFASLRVPLFRARPSVNFALVVMANGVVVLLLLTLMQSSPSVITVAKAITVAAVVGILIATLWNRIRTLSIVQDIISILPRSIRWIPFVFLFGSNKNETKKKDKVRKQSHTIRKRKKEG